MQGEFFLPRREARGVTRTQERRLLSKLMNQPRPSVAAAPGRMKPSSVSFIVAVATVNAANYFFRYLTSAATASTSTTTTRIHTSPPAHHRVHHVGHDFNLLRPTAGRVRRCSWTRFLDEGADFAWRCKHHRCTVALHAGT